MEQDLARFSRMPGVRAEKVQTHPGEHGTINPWILKLTPAGGTTLLEVFLRTRADFHYKEIKP
jgi:hypothetical protein